MASAQPLNADISVFRRVRVQTDQDKHDPVKGMGRFRSRQVIVPGQEVRVLETRDNNVSDAWRYGHPVVRYVRTGAAPTPATERTKTMQQVYSNVDGLHMPIRLTVERRDIFIQKDLDNVGDDLFTDTKNA